MISTVRNKISIDLYVMIRPRGGDFCYTADEFKIMEQDVATAKQLGADGVVFGILQEDGNVDLARSRRLVQAARPMKATFHRAFDMSRELFPSLECVIQAGADRILTSGGEPKAEDAIVAIAQIVRAAGQRIAIMACGGIMESNVGRVLSETGVREIHSSARAHAPSRMQHRNDKIAMGTVKGHEYERMVVVEEKVRRLLNAAAHGVCHGNKAGH